MKADADLEEQLAALQSMDALALRVKWEELYGIPAPPRFRRDFLMRAIVYRLQEKAYGGLKPATRRRLERLAEDLRAGRESKKPRRLVKMKPGTRLLREWRGETHVVEVLPNGFAWRGQTYISLSIIARAITGTTHSGPRFFGLRAKRKLRPVDSETIVKALGS
jgi:Protein of unknown function (DUF2924)